MKYHHSTIKIDQPAPGHFVISGHAPRSVFVEGVGHVVPPAECYVAPELPAGALLAVLEERGELPKAKKTEKVEKGKNPEVDLEALAGELYDVYCSAVGGVAFNGDPLPSWFEFRGDESKSKQSAAWVAVAEWAATTGTK